MSSLSIYNLKFRTRQNPKGGFTLIELAVSVFILGLISTSVLYNLRSTRRTDELRAAARIVAGDLRALQSRALSGQNIKTCTPSTRIVCELSEASCAGSVCVPLPPFGVGVRLTSGSNLYTLFADVDTTKQDWKQTDATEIFLTRDLSIGGAPNVVIDVLTLPAPTGIVPFVDVAFQRQNGGMVIGECISGCNATLFIRLKHLISGDTKQVEVNAITGRVSVP